MTKNVYRYKTSGDEVKVGDKVRYPGFGDGKVLEVLQPESRAAKEWGLPEGAVLLGGFFTREGVEMTCDPRNDEDLYLIERAEDSKATVPKQENRRDFRRNGENRLFLFWINA